MTRAPFHTRHYFAPSLREVAAYLNSPDAPIIWKCQPYWRVMLDHEKRAIHGVHLRLTSSRMCLTAELTTEEIKYTYYMGSPYNIKEGACDVYFWMRK